MKKLNDAEIDALLKQIQNSVVEQAEEKTDDESASTTEVNTPDELLSILEAQIGDLDSVEQDFVKDEYDISGYEIEPCDHEDDEIPEETVVDEHNDCEILAEENSEETTGEADEETEDEAVEEIAKKSVVEDVEESEFSQSFDLTEEETDGADEEIVEQDDSQTVVNEVPNVFDEIDDEGEDAVNEEAVRQRVEQYVNDTVEPVEDFIFFESLDKRTRQADELETDAVNSGSCDTEEAQEENIDEPCVILDEKEAEELEETDAEVLEDVTLSFVKSDEEQLQNISEPDRHSVLDEADINFALSLGDKEPLELAMGFVKVREAKHNFVNPNEKPLVGNVLLENTNGEYKDYSQTSEIKDRYRREKKKIGKRLIFTMLISIVTLFLETVHSFEAVTIPYLSEFLEIPLFYGVISMALLGGAIAISGKKLFRGFIGSFTANANYYTTIGFVTVINLLYSFLSLFAFTGERLILMNSICIFFVLTCIAGEYLQIVREIRTFDLISDERPKISLERVDRSIEMTQKESFLKCNEFYIDNTNFVGKYFERSARRTEIYHAQYTFLTLTTLLSLIVAVTAVLTTRNFYHFVVALELSVLLCVPIQFVLLSSYQFYVVSAKLKRLDSAIIGETLADEYVGNNTIYLDDVEVFGNHGVRVVGLDSYNNFNIVDVHYHFLSVFSQVNGPLKNAFGEVSEKLKLSDNVKLLNVYYGGIEAIVDDKNKIYVGSASFLKNKGVALGRATEDRTHEKDSNCAMYLSVNNALCAKLYLKYSITHRFEAFVEDMAENRAHIGIRTIDPNVTEELMEGLCDSVPYRIRVTRPTLNDIIPIGRRSDSGIITAKNPHMIAKILAEGLKIKRINNVMNILWALYALIGICTVIGVSVAGVFDKVLPAYIILYQVIWTVGVAIYIRNKLRSRKSR